MATEIYRQYARSTREAVALYQRGRGKGASNSEIRVPQSAILRCLGAPPKATMLAANHEGARLKKLSIVIPVYNERSTLAEIVRRVVAVELPLEKEVILVDDCSKDGTTELYDGLKAEHDGVDLQV